MQSSCLIPHGWERHKHCVREPSAWSQGTACSCNVLCERRGKTRVRLGKTKRIRLCRGRARCRAGEMPWRRSQPGNCRCGGEGLWVMGHLQLCRGLASLWRSQWGREGPRGHTQGKSPMGLRGYLCCSRCYSCLLTSHLQDRRRSLTQWPKAHAGQAHVGCPTWDGTYRGSFVLTPYGRECLGASTRAPLRGHGAVQIWVQTLLFPSHLLNLL